MSIQKIVKGLGAKYFDAGFTMPNIGVLKASLSPQNARLLNILDPKRDNGLVSFENVLGGGCVPKVNFQHLNTNRRYATTDYAACSAEVMQNPLLNEAFVVNRYKESGFHVNHCQLNTLDPELGGLYQNQVTGGRSVSSSGVKGIYQDIINGELVISVKGILEDINEEATEVLVDMIGNNPIYGTDVAQEVPIFTTTEQKGMTRHLTHEIKALWRRMGYTGRPIILTASDDLIAWFDDMCNVGCCSDDGIDYSRVKASNFEVYHDYTLADELGDDEFLVVAPEVFATINVPTWKNVISGLGTDLIDGWRLGGFGIKEPSVRLFDNSCMQENANPRLFFELRAKETACNINGRFSPKVDFLAGATYDFWSKAPDAAGVTGVFRYKIKA